MRWEGKGRLVGSQAGEEITELAASRSAAREHSWVLAVPQTQSMGVRDAVAGDFACLEGEEASGESQLLAYVGSPGGCMAGSGKCCWPPLARVVSGKK